MSRRRHLGPRRRSPAPLLALGVVASLLAGSAVYAYDRAEPDPVSVARDASDSEQERPRARASTGSTSPVTVGQDPAATRLIRARVDDRRAARLARLAAERAEQLREERAEARRETRREARREAREALRQAREQRRQARAEAREARNAPLDVAIGSFNVLGSQHTDADGPRRPFPPASVRTARTAGLVAKHGVDVLGTQELQDDQLRDLQARTGMAAYPGFGWGQTETDNSILWDPGVYEMVSGSRFTITFVDRPRPQPILRLRHLATGREFYVVNSHPSPGEGRFLTQRRNAQATLVSVVRDLRSTGLPVLVTGDMNDRAEFYCRVVAPAGLSAANGGSYGSGCRPPPEPMPVDWVVGGGVAGWSGYWRDTAPTENRTSDHFFVSATARLQ